MFVYINAQFFQHWRHFDTPATVSTYPVSILICKCVDRDLFFIIIIVIGYLYHVV
jgi:hypothetical protein